MPKGMENFCMLFRDAAPMFEPAEPSGWHLAIAIFGEFQRWEKPFMPFRAEPINIPDEANFDQLVMNWNQATSALVLDSLSIFNVLNVDAVNAADNFEVGSVQLAKLVQARAGQQPHQR